MNTKSKTVDFEREISKFGDALNLMAWLDPAQKDENGLYYEIQDFLFSLQKKLNSGLDSLHERELAVAKRDKRQVGPVIQDVLNANRTNGSK